MYSTRPSNNFEAKLNALRQLYIRDIETNTQKLEQAALTAEKDPSELNLTEFRVIAHKLAGSGSTFGFPRISEAARAIEQFVSHYLRTPSLTPEEKAAGWQTVRDNIQKLYTCAKKPSESTESSIPEQAVATVVSPAYDQNRSLLLLEDEQDLAQELSTQLRFLGYQVHHREAITAPSEESSLPKQINAILIDANERDPALYASYIEALDLPKKTQRETPIIFLSKRHDMAARLAALRAGGTAFFTKPTDVGVIIDSIERFRQSDQAVPLRILIIEDQENMALFYAYILKKGGFDVRIVLDPQQVMEVINEFIPDLLLIDMYMPYCSGIELAQIIRQQESFISIPIVYLSAETDTSTKLDAMKYGGGDDFISKPVDPTYLISTVRIRALRHQRIREQIVRDGLTGLLNHIRFKEQIQIELLRAARNKEPVTLAMIDIDHFKSVNDQYGHPVGDRVLRLLARFLEQRFRSTDICGRFGGEEFGVLLIGAKANDTHHVITQLLIDFGKIKQTADDNTIFHVTFSCGIADNSMASDAAHLTRYADEALYQAKRSGRNRAVIYTLEQKDDTTPN